MRVLILLALLGTALAAPKSVSRIVGGEPTTINNYPYMSNMQYLLWGVWWMQWCGGSLITQNVVLSAAHCYIGDSPSSWRVRLGTSFASSGGTIHAVTQLFLHQNYNTPTLDNDIALIRLATPATLSPTVQAVGIAGLNYNVPDGAEVISIGWGALYSDGPSPEQLQHVVINIINQELCAERYAYLKTLPGYQNWPDITPGMLCAGILNVGGKDACQGDSGGPLTHRTAQFGDVLVGVVSWGEGCADPFYPGVNARVSQYSTWIASNA